MMNEYVDRLRTAITHGEFMPNERLLEEHLTGFLGTSRTNVRTALVRLEQEGLVTLERNRGARVRIISEAEAIEIAQARGVLEILIARHAAMNANDQHGNDLHGIMRHMHGVYDAGDLLAYSSINGNLHAKIRDIADHGVAAKLLSNLKSQMVRFQYRSILLPGRAKQSLGEHDRLVGAICAQDVDGAENAMRVHMRHVVNALGEAIERSQKQHAEHNYSATS